MLAYAMRTHAVAYPEAYSDAWYGPIGRPWSHQPSSVSPLRAESVQMPTPSGRPSSSISPWYEKWLGGTRSRR